jgi:L-serine dehydratase
VISVFDLFKIGIGPSSSHTVGPMRAARTFVGGLKADGLLAEVASVHAELFGSLGATGHGHGSDKAVLLGLAGEDPESVDTDTADDRAAIMRTDGRVALLGVHEAAVDLVLHRRRALPYHPNGMTFAARDADGTVVRTRTYYSVGGGFVVDEAAAGADRIKPDDTPVRYPFTTGAELMTLTRETGLRISDIVLANELSWRSEADVRSGLLNIWRVMSECVENGCTREGTLPGGLKVRRRAAELRRQLQAEVGQLGMTDPLRVMDWVTLFALAVNEENAAGGRVVTAPTNGAAGVIPAVIAYHRRFLPGPEGQGTREFLLTAAAVGMLYKRNASLSAAEMGCQGEVGVACSMAAAGLAAVMGGTNEQIENAAEIGMEHNLGLTCDPVAGLVQIPCIERNAMGSLKAISAARLALHGDGSHKVSLDQVISTMRQTGIDMSTIYKETSQGGLAVNVPEC